MTDTINGRTLEEIKQGLGYCCPKWESGRWVTCRDECPFRNEHAFCKNVLMACTLALLCQLEREHDELLQKNQQLVRERDAAVEALCKIDETLIKHNSTGTHGCMNEVRKAVNDGLIGVICAREAKPDEQIRT